MNKKVFNLLGWFLLIIIGLLWLIYGYLSIYLLLVPVTYLAFLISDGSVKKLKKLKNITLKQSISILLSFIISIAIVFGFIQFANYIINIKLELSGWLKTTSQIVAVIISLYPVKFTFGSFLYRINNDLNAKSEI